MVQKTRTLWVLLAPVLLLACGDDDPTSPDPDTNLADVADVEIDSDEEVLDDVPDVDVGPDTDVGPDADVEEPQNACGGTTTLQFSGAAAEPGDSCGPCGSVLVCDGMEALRCEAVAENACGGCGTLGVEVGAACGTCGGGTYTCDGEDDVTCVGAIAPNACGGCETLTETPGEACTDEIGPGTIICEGTDATSCAPGDRNVCGGLPDELGYLGQAALPGGACGVAGDGTLQCDGPTTLACTGATPANACGGVATLVYDGAPAAPGETCGACGLGSLVCDGNGALRCAGDSPQNGCGGCATLYAEPGEGCGVCSTGVVVCEGTESVRCDEPNVTACGGCDELGALPGESCGAGQAWFCQSQRTLACGADTLNHCGGTEPLLFEGAPASPGTLCGIANTGVLVCVGTNALTCGGIPPDNACGGSVELPGTPGASCGPCGTGTWTCTDNGDLRCLHDGPVTNACGGCTALDGEPGAACFDGALVCDGTDAVACSGTLVCETDPVSACGGCATLPLTFGEACGTCGLGTIGCGDADATLCMGDPGDDARNACGGCSTLAVEPGVPCGRCGAGTYTCQEEGEAVACLGDISCETGATCVDDTTCGGDACVGGRCVSAGFVYVPAGQYLRGEPSDVFASDTRTKPQHPVTITRAFLLSTYEVTQDEYLAAMGVNPSTDQTCGGNCPVESVSFVDAVRYANARSAAAGLTPCYEISSENVVSDRGDLRRIQDCLGYRLPTDAEWEYAYRAGSTTDLVNGNITVNAGLDPLADVVGWYSRNSGGDLQPVGGKAPNAWGLYDMAGNVQEWIHDPYSSHPVGSSVDPSGSRLQTERTLRGGAYNTSATGGIRAAFRNSRGPTSPNFNIGFRLARTVPGGICDNSLLDGNETDVDCGGACEPCQSGETCALASDCATGLVCDAGTCAPDAE